MREITIQDVGPIHNLTIPVPEKGGVVVLQGWNGEGKSKALEAVGSLMSGEGALEPRYGALSGEVDGLGCRIRVGRRTSRAGELEVLRLEGGDPSVFVNANYLKDPESADAVRARELCRLARVEIADSAWVDVAGSEDELRAIARPKTLAEKDPVAKAKLLKADFDSAALMASRESENWLGRAQGMAEAIKGIDLSAPCDGAALRAEEDAASRALVEIETRAKGAAAAARSADSARQSLAAAVAAYTGPTVEQAEAAVQEAGAEVASAEAAVHEAELALERAKGAQKNAYSMRSRATQALQAAQSHVAAISGWEASIEAAQNARPAPTELEIADATARVATARDAAERGAIVRAALDKQAKAHEAALQAGEFKARSTLLRERAKACEGVITEAISRVAPRGLRFQDGRLVLDVGERETYFGELSDGQRWQVGFDIACDAAGPGAVIPIEQRAWQDLDPRAKAERARHAEERGVVILTAECTQGGELRAQVFVPEQVKAAS